MLWAWEDQRTWLRVVSSFFFVIFLLISFFLSFSFFFSFRLCFVAPMFFFEGKGKLCSVVSLQYKFSKTFVFLPLSSSLSFVCRFDLAGRAKNPSFLFSYFRRTIEVTSLDFYCINEYGIRVMHYSPFSSLPLSLPPFDIILIVSYRFLFLCFLLPWS